MKALRILLLTLGLCAAAGSAPAQERKAFANLEFGDSADRVEEKLRALVLEEGDFERPCYGCAVNVRLAGQPFSVEPDLHAGGLWRVQLRHAYETRGRLDPAGAREAWESVRHVLRARFGRPALASSSFPVGVAGREPTFAEVVTDEWRRDGKRIELAVEYSLVEEQSREGLWSRIQKGWVFGSTPYGVEIRHFDVVVRVTDTVAEARDQAERTRERDKQRRERVSQSALWF